MSKTIAEWQTDVHRCAYEHGWWTELNGILTTDQVLAKLALVHSEVSEAVEAVRECQHAHLRYPPDGSGKPEGLVVELADAVIRIMDLCERMGLDLEDALAKKHAYNQNRPYRHGGKLA